MNKHKSHFVVFYHKLLILTILGELQSDFCKYLTEFDQISLKILPYLTDFSPQLMACMSIAPITAADGMVALVEYRGLSTNIFLAKFSTKRLLIYRKNLWNQCLTWTQTI